MILYSRAEDLVHQETFGSVKRAFGKWENRGVHAAVFACLREESLIPRAEGAERPYPAGETGRRPFQFFGTQTDAICGKTFDIFCIL